MITEALSRLKHFAPLEEYRYFGMGSLYFRDHIVLHKRLGISDLTSIEHGHRIDSQRRRYEFNRPYDAVKLLFGTPSDVAGHLDKRPVVAWFDYEDHLCERFLDDIAMFCQNVSEYSVLIVTVNAEPPGGTEQERVNEIRKELGARVPSDLSSKYFRKERLADLYRAKFEDEVQRALASRAPNANPQEQLRYHPLFHFRYQDGQPLMLTIGGIFARGEHVANLERADFASLLYVTQNDKPFRIDVPKLTLRETQYLDRLLPTGNAEEMAQHAESEAGIPKHAAKLYARLYRYLPSFADVDV